MSVTRTTSAELKHRTDDAAPNAVARRGLISGLKGGSARRAASDHPTDMEPVPRLAFYVSGISQG